MMGAAREKDQADFDLERFIEIFDEAMTSRDPRVIDTLRSLMMIVMLTRPETHNSPAMDRDRGPLRRLFEDVNHLNSRLYRAEEELQDMRRQMRPSYTRERVESWEDTTKYPYEKYAMKASDHLAAQIDKDVLAKLKAQGVAQIKGLK